MILFGAAHLIAVGRAKVIPFPTKDPLVAAEQAGLEYTSDNIPGIQRVAGPGFVPIPRSGWQSQLRTRQP